MDTLSPYLNLTSTTRVKVKTVLDYPAEKEGVGTLEWLKISVFLRANKQVFSMSNMHACHHVCSF